MKIKYSDLSVCVDCTMLIANGEVQDDGRDITEEHAAKVAAQWGEDAIHLVLSCPDECEGWSSSSECDGCGSTLGGERHPAAVLTEDNASV